MPEKGDDTVTTLDGIDEVPDEVPGLTGAEVHVTIKSAVHDRERDLDDIGRLLFATVIGPEWVAHPVPEPGAVGIAEGRVIREPSLAEVLPGFRYPEPEEVVSVASDLTVEDFFQPILFFLQFLYVPIGLVPAMEADLPSPVGDHADLRGEVFDFVGVVLIAVFEGEEEEGGGGVVLLLK